LTLAQTANPRYLDVMTFQSLPYDPRPLTATEARLEAIYAPCYISPIQSETHHAQGFYAA